jgi:hypothetical protein
LCQISDSASVRADPGYADPLTTSSGTRYFFSDESNMIRYKIGGAAGPADSALH